LVASRRAVLLASNSLSHLHFDRRTDLTEDMGREHPFNKNQDRADMVLLEKIPSAPAAELRSAIREHIAASAAETKSGSVVNDGRILNPLPTTDQFSVAVDRIINGRLHVSPVAADSPDIPERAEAFSARGVLLPELGPDLQ
jgi:hypothetical protein